MIKDLLPPTPPPVVPLNIRNRDAFFEGRSSQKTEHEKVDEIKLAAEIVLKLKNWQQNMDKVSSELTLVNTPFISLGLHISGCVSGIF